MIKERLTALQELESRSAAELRKAYNALDEVLDVRAAGALPRVRGADRAPQARAADARAPAEPSATSRDQRRPAGVSTASQRPVAEHLSYRLLLLALLE